jgi:hypothetical protein
VTENEPSGSARRGPTAARPAGSTTYEIRVRGHLGDSWAAWFDGLSIANEDDGTCVIRGPIVDQAALHGLLQKLRDLGLPLESVASSAPDGSTEPRLPESPSTNHPSGATS